MGTVTGNAKLIVIILNASAEWVLSRFCSLCPSKGSLLSTMNKLHFFLNLMFVVMNPQTGIACLNRYANICIAVSCIVGLFCRQSYERPESMLTLAPVSTTKVTGEPLTKMVTLGVLGDARILSVNTDSSLDVGDIVS